MGHGLRPSDWDLKGHGMGRARVGPEWQGSCGPRRAGMGAKKKTRLINGVGLGIGGGWLGGFRDKKTRLELNLLPFLVKNPQS